MLNPDNAKKGSRRLDPEVRKHMILDKAAVVASAMHDKDAADFLTYLATEAGPAFTAQGFTVLGK